MTAEKQTEQHLPTVQATNVRSRLVCKKTNVREGGWPPRATGEEKEDKKKGDKERCW